MLKMGIANRTTEIWESCGLLEQLSDEQKNEFSKVLEEIANYLISEKHEKYAASMLIFPILRRIYGEINKGKNKLGKFSLIINCVDLYYEVKETYDRLEIETRPERVGMDNEAEFCCLFVEGYINDLKKRGII